MLSLPTSPSLRLSTCVLFLALAASLTGLTCRSLAATSPSPLEKAIMPYLVCMPGAGHDTAAKPLVSFKDQCLAIVYLGTGRKPLWVTENGVTDNAWIILHHLKYSHLHGLDSKKYQLDRMLALFPSRNTEELAELDTLLSYGLVRYMHDITQGQFEPHELDPNLFAEAGALDFDPLQAIKNCLAAEDLNQYLTSLAPAHNHYTRLKAALEKYRKIEANGGWLTIPPGNSMRPGDNDLRVKGVRLRLLQTDGDDSLPPSDLSPVYDNDLRKAVIRFQKRHGLETDGVIGPNTLAAMNVPISERIQTMRLNLARWHWQAHDLGKRYVLVNIAGFQLLGIDNDTIEIEIPVIVGKQQHQTPVFSDHVRYLEFNPFWTVPTTIARKEELPKLRKNPNYLVQNNIRLFAGWDDNARELDSTKIDWHAVTPRQMSSYRLRQDPGPWNALGKLKFVFPNSYSVYMHGTPAVDLFNRNSRSFSHGCIRVSDPPALAGFILHNQPGNWTAGKIDELYRQDDRKTISLAQPVPVHITYQTSWVDKNGLIHFNSDIYSRDEKLRQALYR